MAVQRRRSPRIDKKTKKANFKANFKLDIKNISKPNIILIRYEDELDMDILDLKACGVRAVRVSNEKGHGCRLHG